MSLSAGSILLALLALVATVLAVFTTVVPFLGFVVSFGAPSLALGGIVMGGVAMSRAAQTHQSTAGALTGLILSVVAFLPASLVALTCGVCNVCVSAAGLEPIPPQWPPPDWPHPDKAWDLQRGSTLMRKPRQADAGTEGSDAALRDEAPVENPPGLPPPPLPAGPARVDPARSP